ncbi:hypothetical protein ElyMa_000810500 [Elysia marginata]|uniref:Reverse transcriptase domain-containing protein n=1 Tax=Elysia marginata TaxID=1093978 RepID=A0AAV4GXA5_9GAST|nr:hypothetical protein ElyMa_000810500 [Elysia marginata]
MPESLNDHTSVPINGRPICNLRLADDIDLMAASNSELQDLTRSAAAYRMEASAVSVIVKSKVMINSKEPKDINICINGTLLVAVDKLKMSERHP